MNEGRSIQETRRIAEEGIRRFQRFAELWDLLSDEEQLRLISEAEKLVPENER